MFNRIPILLLLVGAALVILVGIYGLVLYSAAVEADATQDNRNKLLVQGEIDSHRHKVRQAIDVFAVSDDVYAAIQNGESARLEWLLCQHTLGTSPFSTIGAMSFSGQALVLCEGGSAKNTSEYEYIFEHPRQFLNGAFDQFLAAQKSYDLVLPELSFKELYALVVERPYLINAALSAPQTRRAMPVTYKPTLLFGFANLRSLMQDIELRVGVADMHLGPVDIATSLDNFIAIGGANHGTPAEIRWRASGEFREQLLRAAPVVVLPSLVALVLVGYFLVRIEKLRVNLVASESQMRHMALHDSLTGLPNRTHFQDLLAQAVADSTEDRPNYTGIFDLDRFKSVNDSFGHDIGDKLLQETARHASDTLGADNVVARLGGDEFAVILRSARSDADALAMLTAMGVAIGQKLIIGDTSVRPSASIGAARISTNVFSIGELMKRADIALYEVKANGGGNCRLFGT